MDRTNDAVVVMGQNEPNRAWYPLERIGLDRPTGFSARSLRLCVPVVMVVFTMLVGACSGSADITATPAATDHAATTEEVAPQTDAAEDTSPTQASATDDSAAPDCDELASAFTRLRGASTSLFSVEDEAGLELLLASDVLLADIELFRPYQDLDVVPFGPIRDGLDNLEHDLTAAGEGRFADMIRDYQSAGMGALLGSICG